MNLISGIDKIRIIETSDPHTNLTETPENSKNLDQLFKSTFEQAAVGIAHVSSNGQFLRVNRKFCEILGYTDEELLEKSFSDITFPKDLDRDQKKVNQLHEGKIDTYSVEKRYVKKDENIIWATLTLNLISNEVGDPECFLAVIQDISIRKNAEEQLKLSEEKFRGVFETMIDVFTRADLEGNCLLISPSVKEVVGYSAEEVIGKNYSEFYAYPDQWWEDARKIREANGKPLQLEREIKRKDGSRIYISSNAKVFFDDDGNPAGIESVFRDITQHKLSESEHDKLFNYSFDLLGIAGTDGFFKELNPSWEKTTGYSLEQLKSVPFLEFVHPEDRNKTLSEMEHLSKGDVTIDFENRYIKANGKVLHLSWTATPMPEEKLLYCSARDITERKHVEEQILKYQQRLKDLARELTITEEKTKKQIAVDLHDNVGQMLSSIRMHLSRIEQIEENTSVRNQIRSISESLIIAIQSTRNAIFNLSLPQLSELGLSAAISDWAKSEVVDKHNLRVDVLSNLNEGDLPEEMRILLFRSIKELIYNVLKHAGAQSISIDLEQKNNNLTIQVKDDGIGFNYNPDLLRLKSNVYGLFSIQERITDLGGSMIVESNQNDGTTISLHLPLNSSD